MNQPPPPDWPANGWPLDQMTRWLKAQIRNHGLEINHETPFTLASGQTSPYYLDLRRVLSARRALRVVGAWMNTRIHRMGGPDEIHDVGGMETGAIGIAAAVSAMSPSFHSLGWFYVRKAVKEHGARNRLEGLRGAERKSVVLVEDVVTTGESLAQAAEVVMGAGAEVVAALAIVDRCQSLRRGLSAEIPLFAMYTLGQIIAEPEEVPEW